MNNNSEYLTIAQQAYQSGSPSPYMMSSNYDMAHLVGLWARDHNITPLEVKPSRGYIWILNRQHKLNFK